MVNLVYFIYHAMTVRMPPIPLSLPVQSQPQLDPSAPSTPISGTTPHEGGKEESDQSIEDKVGQLRPLFSLFVPDVWVAQATLSVASGSSSTAKAEGNPSSA
jgi:hypothetical protein